MDEFHESMLEYSFPFYKHTDIQLKDRLGRGGTGSVYSGKLNICDGPIDCVIKKVCSNYYDDYENNCDDKLMYTDIIDEVHIGHRFMGNSEYQIQFYGYSVFQEGTDTTIYLLMEKTNGSDLSNYIGSSNLWNKLTKKGYQMSQSKTKMYNETSNSILYWDYTLPVDTKLNLIKGLCLAVQDLHSFKIVHCDLKSANMLYAGEKIKLIDYGASQLMNNNKEIEGPVELGTPGYMAKEMKEGWISYQGDIYAVGVCMLEIWFGDIWPSDTNDYKKCRRYVLDYLYLLKNDNLKLHNLIMKCVSTDVKKRPLTKTILSNLDHILLAQGTVV